MHNFQANIQNIFLIKTLAILLLDLYQQFAFISLLP